MDKKYKWQPLYVYKPSFFQKVKMFFGGVLTIVLIIMSLMSLVNNIMVSAVMCGIIALILGFSTAKYSKKALSIREVLEKASVEFFDKKSLPGLLYVRTSNNMMGVFNPKCKTMVIAPTHIQVVAQGTYFLLEDDSCNWGVYNRELGKLVLPYEYSAVMINKSGNIIATKSNINKEYSPYGSLIN